MFSYCEALQSIRDISLNNSYATNINKPSDRYNSNNSGDKSDNLKENDKSKNFYNDNVTLSTIQKKQTVLHILK